MDRHGRLAGYMNECAIFEKTGIQCRKGVLLEVCKPRKIGLDLRIAGALDQGRHRHTGTRRLQVGKR